MSCWTQHARTRYCRTRLLWTPSSQTRTGRTRTGRTRTSRTRTSRTRSSRIVRNLTRSSRYSVLGSEPYSLPLSICSTNIRNSEIVFTSSRIKMSRHRKCSGIKTETLSWDPKLAKILYFNSYYKNDIACHTLYWVILILKPLVEKFPFIVLALSL